jgi:hypothetical protein
MIANENVERCFDDEIGRDKDKQFMSVPLEVIGTSLFIHRCFIAIHQPTLEQPSVDCEQKNTEDFFHLFNSRHNFFANPLQNV